MKPSPEQMLRSLRVIIPSLAMGLLAFTGIGYAIAIGRELDADLARIMLIVVATTAGGSVATFFAVRQQMLNRASEGSTDPESRRERGSRAYFNITMIAAALTEGVGLLAAVTAIVSGEWRVLAVSALSAIVILTMFPMQNSVEGFIERYTAPAVR